MAKASKTYQQMRTELDELMAWFESGDVDLDEAVGKYEQGVKLIKELEDYLQTAENKITQVKASLEASD